MRTTAADDGNQLGSIRFQLQLPASGKLYVFIWRIKHTGRRLLFAAGGLMTVVSIVCIAGVF